MISENSAKFPLFTNKRSGYNAFGSDFWSFAISLGVQFMTSLSNSVAMSQYLRFLIKSNAFGRIFGHSLKVLSTFLNNFIIWTTTAPLIFIHLKGHIKKFNVVGENLFFPDFQEILRDKHEKKNEKIIFFLNL